MTKLLAKRMSKWKEENDDKAGNDFKNDHEYERTGNHCYRQFEQKIPHCPIGGVVDKRQAPQVDSVNYGERDNPYFPHDV